MSRLSKTKVHHALEIAAQHILDARGDDPTISRRDIRLKLESLSGTERALTAIFYRFIDKRDYKPGARVTARDVASTLAYAKEKLVDAYDLNNNGLSKAEVAQMSTTAKLAVALAREIAASGSEQELLNQLREMGEGLLWLGRGSEHDPYLRFFHQPAELTQLTRDTFAEALELDLQNRQQALSFFEQGFEEYGQNFETYEYYELWEELSQIRRLDQFMQAKLRDITHIIVGEDGFSDTSEYPTYFVGLTPNGDIAGFETEMVWT